MKQLFHSPALPSILILLVASALAGCSNIGSIPYLSDTSPQKTDEQVTSPLSNAGINTPVKVTMLLPLSGRDASLGEAMQNAATMAFEDQGYPAFELLFEDTESTPSGAAAAAKNAVQSGSAMVIGPIFADETRAAGTVTAAAHIPMISFSTDTAAIGTNRWLFGIMPQDQAKAILTYTAVQNLSPEGVLIIAPNTSYGQLITHSFTQQAKDAGIGTYGPIWTNTKTLQNTGDTLKNAQDIKYRCAFIPMNAQDMKTILESIKTAGLPVPNCVLGTNLLDDSESKSILSSITATKFYHSSITTKDRNNFIHRYNALYGNTPQKLTSLSYDATSLGLILGREGSLSNNLTARLLSPSGFMGIDGSFTFTENGINHRQLSIISIP